MRMNAMARTVTSTLSIPRDLAKTVCTGLLVAAVRRAVTRTAFGDAPPGVKVLLVVFHLPVSTSPPANGCVVPATGFWPASQLALARAEPLDTPVTAYRAAA